MSSQHPEIMGKLGLAADEVVVAFELGICFATSCLIWLSIFQALWSGACLVLPYAKTSGSPQLIQLGVHFNRKGGEGHQRGTGEAEEAGSQGQKLTGKAEGAKSQSQKATKSLERNW